MQPPHPKRKIKKKQFVDTIMSKVIRDLSISLNQPLKSADDRYTGILKNIINTYVDFFFFSFNCPCNLTRYRLRDLEMIFITQCLK
jgi:hypothetical protein